MLVERERERNFTGFADSTTRTFSDVLVTVSLVALSVTNPDATAAGICGEGDSSLRSDAN